MIRLILITYLSFFLLIRFMYFRTPNKQIIEHKKDMPTQVYIIVLVIVFFLYLMGYLNPLGADIGLISLIGLPFLMLSLIVVYLAQKELGSNGGFSLSIQKKHKLITKGIYSKIRHPIYLSVFLGSIGTSLLSSNLIILLMLVLYNMILYFRAIKEEHQLANYFGSAYRDYILKTRRFL